MKTAFKLSNKDNVATATLIAASLFVVASGLFNSNPAVASYATEAVVQKMDTIVVTASHAPDATLETIVVSASRNTSRA